MATRQILHLLFLISCLYWRHGECQYTGDYGEYNPAVVDYMDMVSDTCRQDYEKLVVDYLYLYKMYAIKVYDSMGAMPSALAQGNTEWLGSFDQCRNTFATDDEGNPTNGFEYCLATMAPFVPGVDVYYKAAVCLPASCVNETDALIISNYVVNDLSFAEENSTIMAVETKCHQDPPLTVGDSVAITLCVILALLAIIGTTRDVLLRMKIMSKAPTGASGETAGPTEKKQGKVRHAGEDLFMSFSWLANGERLLDTRVRPGTLPSLNGVRVLSTWWIVLGHTFYFISNFAGNSNDYQEIQSTFAFQTIYNSGLAVDTFFFLSGFLVAYLTLKELNKTNGKKNWAVFYFHRFWRITPVYMFVIMLTSTLYLHLPPGPRTSATAGLGYECQKYWWTNILYLNHIVYRERCIGWTWYLGNDMQFYIISPILLYLLYKVPKIGVIVNCLFIFISILTIAVVSRVYGLMPTGLGSAPPGYDYEKGNWLYYYPIFRISPYILGLLVGYWANHKKMEFNMPKWAAVIGWAVAIGTNIACAYGLYYYNHNGLTMNVNVAALYNALFRFCWALSVAWVVVACSAGYGGPINIILSWKFWLPMSRLTYLVYLLHPLVILYYYAASRDNIYVGPWTMIYLFLAHLVITHLVAIVFTLAVEMPMIGVEKILLGCCGLSGRKKAAKQEAPVTTEVEMPIHATNQAEVTKPSHNEDADENNVQGKREDETSHDRL